MYFGFLQTDLCIIQNIIQTYSLYSLNIYKRKQCAVFILLNIYK